MSDIGEAMEAYYEKVSLWFGKYKNVPLREVPSDYLRWIKTLPEYKKYSKSLKKAINKNIR